MPVLNNGGEVRGLLRFLDLLQLLLPPATAGVDVKKLHASLENISATIGADSSHGAELRGDEEDLIMMVGASSQDTIGERLGVAKSDGLVGRYLVICGDRPVVHEHALEYGARALVIHGRRSTYGGAFDEGEERRGW